VARGKDARRKRGMKRGGMREEGAKESEGNRNGSEWIGMNRNEKEAKTPNNQQK
jgi:hypothetical protein